MPVSLFAAFLCTVALGLLTTATLLSQLRGHSTPAWLPLLPAIVLLVALHIFLFTGAHKAAEAAGQPARHGTFHP